MGSARCRAVIQILPPTVSGERCVHGVLSITVSFAMVHEISQRRDEMDHLPPLDIATLYPLGQRSGGSHHGRLTPDGEFSSSCGIVRLYASIGGGVFGRR